MRELDVKRLALNVADEIDEAIGDVSQRAFMILVENIESAIKDCIERKDD